MKSQSGGCFDASKRVGSNAPADEPDPFPGSLLISYMDSQGTDEEPCHNDAQNEEQGDRVICSIIRLTFISETFRIEHIAAEKSQQYTDQHTKTEKLHQEGKTKIKVAAQKRPVK